MLIITRQAQTSFTIGDDIAVNILGIDQVSGQVRIGIVAPKSVAIKRDNMVKNQPKNKHAEGTPEYHREQQRQTISLNGNQK